MEHIGVATPIRVSRYDKDKNLNGRFIDLRSISTTLVPGEETMFVNAAIVGIGRDMDKAMHPPVLVDLLLLEDTSNVDEFAGYGERGGGII